MKFALYIVIDSLDPFVINEVEANLMKLCSCSFSPGRPQASLNDCTEVYATITTRDFEGLLPKLNKFWNISQKQWADYGFNTPMFHPNIYYLEIME